MISFTGSPPIGWDIKRRAGRKIVVLELGGNAGVMVEPDSDIDLAAKRIAFGAFVYSGQVCISVQRAYIHILNEPYDSPGTTEMINQIQDRMIVLTLLNHNIQLDW